MYLAQSQTQSTCTQHSQRYSLHVPSTVTDTVYMYLAQSHIYSLHVPSTVTDTVYMYLAQSEIQSTCT